MDERLIRTDADKALATMQSIELVGLQELDRICRKHNIKYSLGGGTCLGQVRHGGFIPWDDDIDVDMTMENYNKFMEVAPKEMDSSRFVLRSRATDPTHLRTACRLEMKDTVLGQRRFDKTNKQGRVFVDIFRWNYLPDDPKKRKKIARRLFFIHCMQDIKAFDVYAKKLDKKYHFVLRELARILPKKTIERIEDHYANYCKGEKTGWIIDDAIINGDHGGYPSDGIDEYEDVTFEGITVMNKKNPHNFLRTLYGDNYNEWLPPAKRVSHHNWTKIDFGDYSGKYALSDSYKEYMTINHTYTKLKQMKIVSDMMVRRIGDICEKHGIHYVVEQVSEDVLTNSFPEAKDIWTGPVRILMLRDDYDKFAAVCGDELGKQYEYQSHDTEPKYYFYYAKVRLNYTRIHDRKFPLRLAGEMNEGLFVSIIPLDDCPDTNEGKNVRGMVRRWNRYLRLRWTTVGFIDFTKLKFKNKVKLIRLWRWTPEKIYKKIDKAARQFNGKGYGYCYSPSGQLGRTVFRKDELLSTNRIKTAINGLDKVNSLDEFINNLASKYDACHLTYYDIPEWQISSLRYDEKGDRFLTNEELFR